MRRSIRFACLSLFVMVAVFGCVPAARADAPLRQDLPAETFILSDVCAFDVLVEFPTNKEKIATFVDKDGLERFSIITGALKMRVTSANTSLEFNVAGPLRVDPQANGAVQITYRGAGLLWFPANDSDLPALAFVHGVIVTQFDAEGNFSVVSTGGHVEDVCAMLAGS